MYFFIIFLTTPLTTIRIALNFVKFWTIDQNIFCGINVNFWVRVKGWLNISNKCLLILAAGAAHARSVAGGRGQAASHPRSLGAAAAEDGEWWWCDPQPRPGHLNPTPDSAVSQRIRRILINSPCYVQINIQIFCEISYLMYGYLIFCMVCLFFKL